MIKEIDMFNGYEVSDTGRVFSLNYNHTGKRKELKMHKSGSGYLQVNLNGKWVSVHRLVATAFIPNPENKKTVNHKNCNRHDNNVGNLEWATHSENIIHGIKYGKIKPKKGQESCLSKLKDDDINHIRKLYSELGISHSLISKMYNVNQSTITRIINKKTWKHL